MRKFIIILLSGLFCDVSLYAQDSAEAPPFRLRNAEKHRRFYLENTLDPAKTLRLPQKSVILMVDETPHFAGAIQRMNATECFIDTMAGDSLLVRLINEEIETEHKSKYSMLTVNHYAGNFPESYRRISLNDIRYINMKTPARIHLSRIGSVIMSLSILTIVAAPFAGLGAVGDEKAERRGTVFMAGVSGFAVAVPFFILGKNKKYGLHPSFSTRESNRWNLRKSQ